MTLDIVLFGVESVFTLEMIEAAHRRDLAVRLTVIAGQPEWDLNGLQPVAPPDVAPEFLGLPFAVPWVTPGERYARFHMARNTGFRNPLTLIHPAAVVATTATIDEGVFLNSGATVGAKVQLGAFTLINRNASVGHHTVTEPFVSFGPGVVVAARCRIGTAASRSCTAGSRSTSSGPSGPRSCRASRRSSLAGSCGGSVLLPRDRWPSPWFAIRSTASTWPGRCLT